MVEGLITKQEKPSNTEVLGLLLDKDKIDFITNLTDENIEGLAKYSYFTRRINEKNKSAIEISNDVLQRTLALKCAVQTKKGNRADQIVDALKHIIDDENKDDLKSLAQQIKN